MLCVGRFDVPVVDDMGRELRPRRCALEYVQKGERERQREQNEVGREVYRDEWRERGSVYERCGESATEAGTECDYTVLYVAQ